MRDKIPEIIQKNGKSPVTKYLSDKEYFNELKNKLSEEVDEFKQSNSVEELADILEVVFSLALHLGVRKTHLEEIRLKKNDERGSFNDKVFLIETNLIDNL